MYKCSAIVLLTLLQGMCPQLMQLLNSKHHRTTTNALYKCNTIVLLNKALLQSMHPQLLQLLNLKHNLINYTNALYKCSPTKFESTKMHCTIAVQLNLKHDRTTTNALYKCKTIILLNKALLQGMHPQLMQLLNLKHNLINYTSEPAAQKNDNEVPMVTLPITHHVAL
jgi:hypothetical protein